MGLDTRAYAIADETWQHEWVTRANEQGGRLTMFGLLWERVGQRNYGLTGGYAGGRAPFTFEDAPKYYQDGLDQLPWPGGLIGGMISGNGDAPSFRGKCYDHYVEVVTGHSLYAACDEMWQGDVLYEITDALVRAAANPETVGGGDVEQSEREALANWFRVCVEHNLAVGGDY